MRGSLLNTQFEMLAVQYHNATNNVILDSPNMMDILAVVLLAQLLHQILCQQCAPNITHVFLSKKLRLEKRGGTFADCKLCCTMALLMLVE